MNSFKYDPFGHRIYKSSSSGTSIYAYDGDNLIEETNAAGAVVARYTQTQKVDEPLAMLRSSTTSYYQADGLGSITSLSNTAGALAQTYVFDSFGKQTGSSGSLTNPFQYTAREFDPETSLYYYRSRYYDPIAGRFTQEDTARFSTGSFDFYVYVENGPVNFSDPFGHLKEDKTNQCCNWKNIDIGIHQLENTLNTAQTRGKPYFAKYKPCLVTKGFPQETVRCVPGTQPNECGDFYQFSPQFINVTPLGSQGKKGSCGAVASTLVHELVHFCQWSDPNGQTISEKDAFCTECELFGTGCACCRNPKLCGYR